MFKSIITVALVASASAFAPSTHSAFGITALSAEPEWTPPEGSNWEVQDFEGQMNKLEKEAEDRLDSKIAEIKSGMADKFKLKSLELKPKE
mmetsp:Transcript_13146/g.15452  ORF Transcript_13146/g.15452 Transcript_13146/m.15452 type:complete len:91 (-) Transcript_13146:311-583(-)|eukprot:CAMPEP_0198255622 /NCGR_PEP_ID=MMETSP1447-20131203/5696_1 /TAXON_ID=420782 /ORGANISM="Chaetoceros dichaeta, Strain CCMP1751" /LENGTH=90 /DNA_ID=CAMNT_0043942029 /DNA_START=139 /DNA_END=411 /DNA_ORIENTATION=-